MTKNKRISLFSGMALIMLSLLVFSVTAQARSGKVHLTDKIKTVPPQSGLYKQNIQPLQMQQCAQCHIGVFNLLKAEGKRHQKDCTFCHEVYHTYAPGKVEYQDAIPKCKDCHGTPHGAKEFVQNCGNCHSNAHSPVTLPNITGDVCFNCHANPPKEMKQFVSKHTDLDCTECHTSHGFIPNCTDCHDEGAEIFHIAGPQPNKSCMTCHAGPHKPMEIAYSDDTPQEQCSVCHKNASHAEVFKIVRKANSKHNTEVTCASCHDEHGKIPECATCHDQDGHRAGLETPDCLRCHTNPHDPMNISFSITEPKKVCGGCHTEVYDDLMNSKTRHTNQTCACCHPVHAQIPTCQSCHGVPHGELPPDAFTWLTGCPETVAVISQNSGSGSSCVGSAVISGVSSHSLPSNELTS